MIADALRLGVPVLCGVNALNHAAFLAFRDGAGARLEVDLASLTDWSDRVRRGGAGGG